MGQGLAPVSPLAGVRSVRRSRPIDTDVSIGATNARSESGALHTAKLRGGPGPSLSLRAFAIPETKSLASGRPLGPDMAHSSGSVVNISGKPNFLP